MSTTTRACRNLAIVIVCQGEMIRLLKREFCTPEDNSLECGDLSPLWPAAAWRSAVEEHSNNKGRDSSRRTETTLTFVLVSVISWIVVSPHEFVWDRLELHKGKYTL